MQFTGSGSSTHPPNSRYRSLYHDHSPNHHALFFIPRQIFGATSSAGNATGSDHLNILHLKHLGSGGVQCLTPLFKHFRRVANFYYLKIDTHPVPKPGKPIAERNLFPIHLFSMLCCKSAEEAHSSNFNSFPCVSAPSDRPPLRFSLWPPK